MTKRKKIILSALGTLLALNIAATLINDKIESVKSDVNMKFAPKLAAADITTNNLLQKIDALNEKLLRLEEAVRAQNQSDYDHLKDEIAHLSAYAKTLEAKAAE